MGHDLARLIVALGTALAASAAHAQFDGIFFGAGLGFYKATIQVPDAFTFGNDKHMAGLNLDAATGTAPASSTSRAKCAMRTRSARSMCRPFQ